MTEQRLQIKGYEGLPVYYQEDEPDSSVTRARAQKVQKEEDRPSHERDDDAGAGIQRGLE
ncbi:hypothetical protein CL632_01920 [bacterium]|jgi:hypothetical protein|nr:hypothetical protein [bacterium]MDP6571585.1 hypothetical protein [Patescibacteria group bacterium]MDP6756083.1 hypothetical protein [Patescibacteria group bacterium]|tara:strand:- start:7779 stop:7958 length:180 start_codon:yes stop_codon:yes gene_type:complete